MGEKDRSKHRKDDDDDEDKGHRRSALPSEMDPILIGVAARDRKVS